MEDIERVLDFWFGDCRPDGALDAARRKMWFGSGTRHDACIRDEFGALHERASRGELTAAWSASPDGRLALVIVLDQFSRHIHRGTPAAFACDEAARQLVLDGLDRRIDLGWIPARRAFFYMPLEHAEDIELQRLGVRCFDGLVHAVAPAYRAVYEDFLDCARRHLEVIERFGRFPHRNAILGRRSTAREAEFLKQPGSAF